MLLNAVFLDLLDEDALHLSRVNQLLAGREPEKRMGMRQIRLLTLRPSVDLGQLANKYEPQLPRAIRFMTRGLGTTRTEAPDFLSLIMFQPDYLGALMRVGEADAEARDNDLAELLEPDGRSVEEATPPTGAGQKP